MAYHVAVDMADPYNVLGGFQDHEMRRGPNERWDVTGVRGETGASCVGVENSAHQSGGGCFYG